MSISSDFLLAYAYARASI